MSEDPSSEARNLLRVIVDRTTELTPLKAVASKAIQLAEDERSAAMDLAAVLSSDQALTAKLLRLSNSAYYGYARRISNVREAVILLGMRTVRSVAIASSIIDAFKTPEIEGFDRDLLWAHSVCVGLVAETIARHTRVAQPEDAFTAGVLHDVGKLAMLLAEPKRFEHVVRMVRAGARYRDAEREVFEGIGHEHVGARLANRWKFPEELISAIRWHHPEQLPPRLDSLGDVVAVANHACNREGFASGFDWVREPGRRPVTPLPRQAREAINAVHGGMATIEAKGRTFLQHVTTRPPRWYWAPAQNVDSDAHDGDGKPNSDAA